MLHFDSSHSIVTRGSRTTPHHTFPAFLNLNGIIFKMFGPPFLGHFFITTQVR